MEALKNKTLNIIVDVYTTEDTGAIATKFTIFSGDTKNILYRYIYGHIWMLHRLIENFVPNILMLKPYF